MGICSSRRSVDVPIDSTSDLPAPPPRRTAAARFWQRRQERLAAERAQQDIARDRLLVTDLHFASRGPQVDTSDVEVFVRALFSGDDPLANAAGFGLSRDEYQHFLENLTHYVPPGAAASPPLHAQLDDFTLCYTFGDASHCHTDPEADGDAYTQCVICMTEYVLGDAVRVLPCLHRFHKRCVDVWLLAQQPPHCPICRQNPREESAHAAS